MPERLAALEAWSVELVGPLGASAVVSSASRATIAAAAA
jgi:hypothetical protein